MKKRIPKSARRAMKEMAKDCWATSPHVCPPHEHTIQCTDCAKLWIEAQLDSENRYPPVEKVVYQTPKSAIAAILFFSGAWITAMVGWNLQKPIDKPYPVYHTVYVSDATCQPKLDDCQADYRAQRATIKYLTKRQKEQELP